MPTVTIDDVKVDVEHGATILDAARKASIWIPTLCWHPAIAPQATCRICMVELDRGDWWQLVTACNYPVRRDVNVRATSDRAVSARQGVMRLLLARAPENAQLQALAQRMGVDGADLPTVTVAQRDCILCGLCTGVCEEVIGQSAIGFAGRGQERAVAAPFRQASEDCIACGACAVVCPVGTIQVRIHLETEEVEISPFKSRAKLQTCDECGARVVSVPVAEAALRAMKTGDWEKLRRTARLCPACRRAQTAKTQSEAKKLQGSRPV